MVERTRLASKSIAAVNFSPAPEPFFPSVTGLGTGIAVKPGETIGTVYELGRGGAGTWLVEGDISVSDGADDGGEGHDGGDFPYRVRLAVATGVRGELGRETPSRTGAPKDALLPFGRVDGLT